MSTGGYVKLYRSLQDWQWSDCPEMVALFVHLLIGANYEPSEYRGMVIEKGQLVTSVKDLCEKTGLTVKQTRTCISRLIQTNEIDVKTSNKFSLITVCNFDSYQSVEDMKGQTKGKQRANKGQTKGKPIVKEEKEEKEEKETSTYVDAKKETKTSFELFTEWINTECPNAAMVEHQLTEAEYKKLTTDYTEEQIRRAVENLDNWKEFPKKRRTIYRSVIDELKQRFIKRHEAAPTDRRSRQEQFEQDIRQLVASKLTEE